MGSKEKVKKKEMETVNEMKIKKRRKRSVINDVNNGKRTRNIEKHKREVGGDRDRQRERQRKRRRKNERNTN